MFACRVHFGMWKKSLSAGGAAYEIYKNQTYSQTNDTDWSGSVHLINEHLWLQSYEP